MPRHSPNACHSKRAVAFAAQKLSRGAKQLDHPRMDIRLVRSSSFSSSSSSFFSSSSYVIIPCSEDEAAALTDSQALRLTDWATAPEVGTAPTPPPASRWQPLRRERASLGCPRRRVQSPEFEHQLVLQVQMPDPVRETAARRDQQRSQLHQRRQLPVATALLDSGGLREKNERRHRHLRRRGQEREKPKTVNIERLLAYWSPAEPNAPGAEKLEGQRPPNDPLAGEQTHKRKRAGRQHASSKEGHGQLKTCETARPETKAQDAEESPSIQLDYANSQTSEHQQQTQNLVKAAAQCPANEHQSHEQLVSHQNYPEQLAQTHQSSGEQTNYLKKNENGDEKGQADKLSHEQNPAEKSNEHEPLAQQKSHEKSMVQQKSHEQHSPTSPREERLSSRGELEHRLSPRGELEHRLSPRGEREPKSPKHDHQQCLVQLYRQSISLKLPETPGAGRTFQQSTGVCSHSQPLTREQRVCQKPETFQQSQFQQRQQPLQIAGRQYFQPITRQLEHLSTNQRLHHEPPNHRRWERLPCRSPVHLEDRELYISPQCLSPDQLDPDESEQSELVNDFGAHERLPKQQQPDTQVQVSLRSPSSPISAQPAAFTSPELQDPKESDSNASSSKLSHPAAAPPVLRVVISESSQLSEPIATRLLFPDQARVSRLW